MEIGTGKTLLSRNGLWQTGITENTTPLIPLLKRGFFISDHTYKEKNQFGKIIQFHTIFSRRGAAWGLPFQDNHPDVWVISVTNLMGDYLEDTILIAGIMNFVNKEKLFTLHELVFNNKK